MIGVPALATLSKILDHQRTEAYSQPQFNVPATGPGEKRHHGQERYVKMSTHSREDIYIYTYISGRASRRSSETSMAAVNGVATFCEAHGYPHEKITKDREQT